MSLSWTGELFLIFSFPAYLTWIHILCELIIGKYHWNHVIPCLQLLNSFPRHFRHADFSNNQQNAIDFNTLFLPNLSLELSPSLCQPHFLKIPWSIPTTSSPTTFFLKHPYAYFQELISNPPPDLSLRNPPQGAFLLSQTQCDPFWEPHPRSSLFFTFLSLVSGIIITWSFFDLWPPCGLCSA